MFAHTQKELNATNGTSSFNKISIPCTAPEYKVYKVSFSTKSYKKKPLKSEGNTFREIHNTFDRIDSKEITLLELMNEITSGRVWKHGTYAREPLNDKDYTILREYRKDPSFHQKEQELLSKKKKVLTGTRLAVLDVDDVTGNSNPEQIMKEFNAIALYYSYSHQQQSPIGTAMQRYRLLFDLSETVDSENLLKRVQSHLIKEIVTQYPFLADETYKGKSNGIEFKSFYFGSTSGYTINPDYKSVNVSEIKDRYQKEQRFKELTQHLRKQIKTASSTSEQELLDMADYLGDLSGQLNHDEWTTLSIGLWNTAQVTDMNDELVTDILGTLDGHQQNEKYYLTFKRPLNDSETPATAGTLIKLATDSGFKRVSVREPAPETEQALKINVTTHPIKEYVSKTDILNVLTNGQQKTLLVSDTNTGKTRASIEAGKELIKRDPQSFIYIALPTRALAQQIQRTYGTGKAILGNENVQSHVKQAIYNGTRLLVGTYDKAPLVQRYLKDYNVTIIADEVHKEVTDYNYRHKAINGLFDITEHDNVVKFVGLTGTPSEIDKESYNEIVQFKLEKPKVLADRLHFVTYGSAKLYDDITIKAMKQEVEQGNKVLAFINNKNLIKRYAKALRENGLNVATVTADNRKSQTYRSILDNETLDKDIVLSTIVLADGININNSKNYVCMIAPSHYRNAYFYNMEMIKQATNRFRNQYKKILIPLYVKSEIATNPDHERASDRSFNLDSYHKFLSGSAEIVKASVQVEFENNLNHYTPSIAERVSGLTQPIRAKDFNFVRAYENKERMVLGLSYDTQLQAELSELETQLFTVDKRSIRQQASEEKETYNSLYPFAFKREIMASLNVLDVKEEDAHTYFLSYDNELSEILKTIEKIELKSNDEKREKLKMTLHELIYTRLRNNCLETGKLNESTDEWQLLKDKIHPMQFKALLNLIPFLEYEQAIHELERVKKNAQINELQNQFKALLEIESFSHEETTVTKRIYHEITALMDGTTFSSKQDVKDELDAHARIFKLHKRFSIAKKTKLFEQVFKRFFVPASTKAVWTQGRTIKETSYTPLTLEYMADSRELSVEELMNQYTQFRYSNLCEI